MVTLLSLRQRISRPLRDTLSCSKKLDNSIDAIWYGPSLQFVLTFLGLPDFSEMVLS